MSNHDMFDALQMLAAERGITVDTLLSALADALESACNRRPDAYEYAWVTIDPDSFEFRVFAQDIRDNEQFRKKPLPMPVLAIGASGSLAGSVGDQARQYASDVTDAVVPDSGHWIYEEHPAELTTMLLGFLSRH